MRLGKGRHLALTGNYLFCSISGENCVIYIFSVFTLTVHLGIMYGNEKMLKDRSTLESLHRFYVQ